MVVDFEGFGFWSFVVLSKEHLVSYVVTDHCIDLERFVYVVHSLKVQDEVNWSYDILLFTSAADDDSSDDRFDDFNPVGLSQFVMGLETDNWFGTSSIM